MNERLQRGAQHMSGQVVADQSEVHSGVTGGVAGGASLLIRPLGGARHFRLSPRLSTTR